MNIPAVVKQKPSVWLALISGGAALAQVLTSAGEPHLALAGMILSAVFKVAESAHDAYVGGKKLDVEKQLVQATGKTPPSVIVSAENAGVPVSSFQMAAPTLTASVPAPPVISAPASHVPQG